MVNYFEETGKIGLYNRLTDYQKGIIDGFYEIANMAEEDISPFAEEALAEYMEDFIYDSENNELSTCKSMEESSEVIAKEAIIYLQSIAFDEFVDLYLYRIAEFTGIDAGPFKNDYERVFTDTDIYEDLKHEYATGLTFYLYSQIKLHPLLNDYQNGIIAAYTFLFTELEMNIRSKLSSEDDFMIDIISGDILEAMHNDLESVVPVNTPIMMSTLEAVLPIFMSSSITNQCADYLNEKCSQEYIYYVAELSGEKDEVYDFYEMN